ncbi:MAG TPA: signal peptidase I [Holophagaceae bacterium]|jgi:signal peptidase I|nr:signal peptidase I [Holophagaceae bacterium]
MKRFRPYGLALLIALSPLAVLHPVKVEGHSMEPGLHDGQLAVALWSWCAGTPQRGQVWIVEGPEGSAIKRVIGLPGETVSERGGDLWVGGARLREPYVGQVDASDGGAWSCRDGYLVLGDNRPHSEDGRAWGPLGREAFKGRVVF